MIVSASFKRGYVCLARLVRYLGHVLFIEIYPAFGSYGANLTFVLRLSNYSSFYQACAKLKYFFSRGSTVGSCINNVPLPVGASETGQIRASILAHLNPPITSQSWKLQIERLFQRQHQASRATTSSEARDKATISQSIPIVHICTLHSCIYPTCRRAKNCVRSHPLSL